jgi:predicted esterase
MFEQHFSFEHSRRYYQNDLEGKRHILIALHGYGQLAQYFYRKFSCLPDTWGIVIPEGPHRFYLEGSAGRVGASWMTKEWRAQDIADNNAYLQQLIEKVRTANPKATIHLLGFSQGGATAARFYLHRPELFSQLILWASVFPPDIEKLGFPKDRKLDFVLGKQDPYFDLNSIVMALEEYDNLGFQNYTFEGGHDIDQQTLLAVLNNF